MSRKRVVDWKLKRNVSDDVPSPQGEAQNEDKHLNRTGNPNNQNTHQNTPSLTSTHPHPSDRAARNKKGYRETRSSRKILPRHRGKRSRGQHLLRLKRQQTGQPRSQDVSQKIKQGIAQRKQHTEKQQRVVERKQTLRPGRSRSETRAQQRSDPAPALRRRAKSAPKPRTAAHDLYDRLSEKEKEEFLHWVDKNSHPETGGYLNLAQVLTYLEDNFGVKLAKANGSKFMKLLHRVYEETDAGTENEKRNSAECTEHSRTFCLLLELLEYLGPDYVAVVFHDETQIRVNVRAEKAWIPEMQPGMSEAERRKRIDPLKAQGPGLGYGIGAGLNIRTKELVRYSEHWQENLQDT